MPCSVPERTFAYMVGAIVFCLSYPAAGQTIDRIESVSFSPSQSANLTAHGKGLTGVGYLWTPFGKFAGMSADKKTADVVATFEGQVPANVTPGIYETRVVTAAGVSDAVFLVVDDLASFRPSDACETNPPSITVPTACCINGQINPLKTKFVGLNLNQGQTISVEVFARRLDSLLDPVLRLSDSAGNELAFVDDTTGIFGDAQMEFTAPATGRYVLELRDVKYGGGGRHFFHLRIGTFPIVQGTFPARASTGLIKLVADQRSDTIFEFAKAESSQQSVQQIAAAGHDGSALISVIPIAQNPQLEMEPNNNREQATLIQSQQTAIAGRIGTAGDEDWFEIKAEQAEHLCVTAHTRKLGSPADLLLEIYGGNSKKLQASDVVGQMDAQLSLRLPKPSSYFLRVQEISQQGGATQTYDLDLNFSGRVEVDTPLDRIAVPTGGAVTIPVQVKRLGNSTSLQLSATGLPAGMKSQPVIVTPQQKTGWVTIQSSAELSSPGSVLERIQIEAKLPSGKTIPVLFSPTIPTTPDYKLVRHQTGVFAFLTTPPPYTLSSSASTLSLSPAAEAKIIVTAARSEGWSHPIDIASAVPESELPTGITIGSAQITQATAELTVTASPDTKPGSYSISLSGTSKAEKTVVVQPLPTIDLQILPSSSVE